MQPQPDNKANGKMMEPMYDMASAEGKTMPNGTNNNQPVSYQCHCYGTYWLILHLQPAPGAMPPQMQYHNA